MGRKEDNIKKATEVMHILPQIRNLCIAAHIDHGKTTLSDNLIAGAGMMSSDLAGAARVLDFDEQESARGITINAASASMVHAVDDTDYLSTSSIHQVTLTSVVTLLVLCVLSMVVSFSLVLLKGQCLKLRRLFAKHSRRKSSPCSSSTKSTDSSTSCKSLQRT